MDGAGIGAVLHLGAAAAQLGTAFVASPESAADEGYRTALASGAAHHTVLTAGISGRPARCLANRFTALVAGVSAREIPAYPVAYDAGKALNAAAKAKGEPGYGAQWAGQGAPLARALPAAELIGTLTEEMQTRANPKKRNATVQFIAPDTIREEQDLEDGSRLVVFSDGKTGWTNSGGTTDDLGEETFPMIATNLSHQLLFILLKLSKDPNQANYLGHGVFEWLDASGQPCNLIVDENTGTILKVQFRQKGVVDEAFSDWRDVSGLSLPFHADLAQNDNPVAARSTLMLKVNTHLNLEELKKRP